MIGAVRVVGEALFSQLVLHALAIDVLVNPWPYHLMDPDPAADDRPRDHVRAEWICQHETLRGARIGPSGSWHECVGEPLICCRFSVPFVNFVASFLISDIFVNFRELPMRTCRY